MENKKVNRTRKIRIEVCFDEEELAAIERKMKQAKIKNKSQYIRQMCVFGKVISIEDQFFRKCFDELHRIGTNLNQMTKYAYSTGSLYVEDIQMIKDSYSNIFHMLGGIYYKMDELLNEIKKSGFETLTEKIERILKEK